MREDTHGKGSRCHGAMTKVASREISEVLAVFRCQYILQLSPVDGLTIYASRGNQIDRTHRDSSQENPPDYYFDAGGALQEFVWHHHVLQANTQP